MLLIEQYHALIKKNDYQHDPAQVEIINQLQIIIDQFKQKNAKPISTAFTQFFAQLNIVNPQPIEGAYIWGGVGRGKTWMMDMFLQSLPTEKKVRMHFHHFMEMLHQEFNKFSKGDRQNASMQVAVALSKKYHIICIDEFHVLDIGDAMILAGILEALFEQGVTMVTTSNRPPDDLYKDGLQRDRFLPAIALIKEHTAVMEIKSLIDYRQLKLKADAIHLDMSKTDNAYLENKFNSLATGDIVEDSQIHINARDIPIIKMADNILWVDFMTLCAGPRAVSDYIKIADHYPIVIVSDVPLLEGDQENPTRRFLNLVDELYDRKVRLYISTESDAGELYHGEELKFEFSRAASRMAEMRTAEYHKESADYQAAFKAMNAIQT